MIPGNPDGLTKAVHVSKAYRQPHPTLYNYQSTLGPCQHGSPQAAALQRFAHLWVMPKGFHLDSHLNQCEQIENIFKLQICTEASRQWESSIKYFWLTVLSPCLLIHDAVPSNFHLNVDGSNLNSKCTRKHVCPKRSSTNIFGSLWRFPLTI